MIRATVKIRRDLGKQVRTNAEQLEGKTYTFKFGWTMGDDDPYPGEQAWLADDPNYPDDAPFWIASGDLFGVATMNERIKELAEQATKHYPATDSSGEFSIFDKEKFADLIVRECAEVALREDHEPSECILSHFGIDSRKQM